AARCCRWASAPERARSASREAVITESGCAFFIRSPSTGDRREVLRAEGERQRAGDIGTEVRHRLLVLVDDRHTDVRRRPRRAEAAANRRRHRPPEEEAGDLSAEARRRAPR